MIRDAVTNSTCLIGLERIGRLDLLPQVFSTVLAPPTVAAEVRTPSSWLRVRPVQNAAAVATLKTQMDAGEAEAIALAMVVTSSWELLGVSSWLLMARGFTRQMNRLSPVS